MHCLGFSSLSEVYMYATCFMLGISVLMPLNAMTSAPSYVIQLYKYVTQDENAVPNSEVFWANILTFYNLISVVAQAVCGPTVLTPCVRKLSLTTRFIIAHTLMMLEVLVILVLPTGKSSQTGAIIGFVIVTFAAGAGQSYLEPTCYAMVGPLHPKFMTAVMFGCGFSGVIASVLQCIIKASMADDYDTVLKQAYIYFSLALAFMAVSLVMALCLRFNSFAQNNIAEFRMWKRQQDIKARRARGETVDEEEEREAAALPSNEPAHESHEEVFGRIVEDDDQALDSADTHPKAKLPAGDESDDVVRAVPSSEDLSSMDVTAAQQQMTTSELMQSTRIVPIIKEIYVIQIACFCYFLVSLYVFPSLLVPIDRVDSWFATIAILIYNCTDALGRFCSTLKFLWPSHMVLLIISLARFIFIPLIFLCIYGYIPTHAAAYVITAVTGVTGGLFGSVAMSMGPQVKALKTDGQRVMAGQLMGLSLLAGASIAALLAILTILVMPK